MTKNINKKKILYIITKSNYGGAQRYIYDLASNMPKSFDTVVAFGGTGKKNASTGTLHTKLKEKNIRTILIKNFMRNMSISKDLLSFFEILKIIYTEKPNTLHVTSSKAGGIGAFAGRVLGVKNIIFTSHGLAFDEKWRSIWQRILIWIATWLTMLFSTKTIQITKDTYCRAKKMPLMKNKIILIHNGIKEPTFIEKEKARKQLIINKKEFIYDMPWIGTIAELHKNKNLDLLIKAVAALKENNVNTQLILIGDGEEKEKLKKLVNKLHIKENVHFTGYVKNAVKYLKALDVFVLPSKKEGLPYVLLEAGFAKLPVITSDIPGVKDIIKNKNTGITIKPKKNILADSIKKLIQNNNLSKKYGDNIYSHIIDNFSIKKMLTETIETYSASNPSISLSNFSRRTDLS